MDEAWVFELAEHVEHVAGRLGKDQSLLKAWPVLGQKVHPRLALQMPWDLPAGIGVLKGPNRGSATGSSSRWISDADDKVVVVLKEGLRSEHDDVPFPVVKQ